MSHPPKAALRSKVLTSLFKGLWGAGAKPHNLCSKRILERGSRGLSGIFPSGKRLRRRLYLGGASLFSRKKFPPSFSCKKEKVVIRPPLFFQNQPKLVNFDDCFFVVSAARFANLVRNHQFAAFAAFYQAGSRNFPALCFSLVSFGFRHSSLGYSHFYTSSSSLKRALKLSNLGSL